MNDARVGAWIASWKRLEAAAELRQKHGGKVAGIDRVIDETIEQARVYADLASSPEDVGVAAGGWLQDQEQIRKNQTGSFAHIAKTLMAEAKERKDADGNP